MQLHSISSLQPSVYLTITVCIFHFSSRGKTTIHRQPLDKTRRHIYLVTSILVFVTSNAEETHKNKDKVHHRTGQEGPERE
jgi:hypothetical protein